MPDLSANARLVASLEASDAKGLRQALADGADPDLRVPDAAATWGLSPALCLLARRASSSAKPQKLWPLVEALLDYGATLVPEGPGPVDKSDHPLAMAMATPFAQRLLEHVLPQPGILARLEAPVWDKHRQMSLSLLDEALLSGNAPVAIDLLEQGLAPRPGGPCPLARAAGHRRARRPSTLWCALEGLPMKDKPAMIDALLSWTWPQRDLDAAVRSEAISPNGHPQIVRRFLAAGASIKPSKSKDPGGLPLLAQVIVSRLPAVGEAMVAELLAAGADPNALLDFSMGAPFARGQAPKQAGVSRALPVPASPADDASRPEVRDVSPLGLAAYLGNAGTVSALLAGGARLDHLAQQKVSVLHLACLGNPEQPDYAHKFGHVIDVLLDAGADPGALDSRHRTPFEYWTLQRPPVANLDPQVLPTAQRLLAATLAARPNRARPIDKQLPKAPDPNDAVARSLRHALDRFVAARSLDKALPRKRAASRPGRL